MPCPGPLHFSYSFDYIYDFYPLPDPDVGLSVFVCDVGHTSFHFGLCGRKFVLCLFRQCPVDTDENVMTCNDITDQNKQGRQNVVMIIIVTNIIQLVMYLWS